MTYPRCSDERAGRHWVRASSFLATFLLATTLASSVWGSDRHTKDSLDLVKKNLAEKKALLVDVREPAEWKRGHLADALLLPLSELVKRAEDKAYRAELGKKLPPKKIIYTHCRSGHRSVLAADVLKKLGYDVRPLKAGYKDLLEAGFPPAPKEENADKQPTPKS